MSQREVGTLVFLAAGLIILAVTIWARRGGSYRARRWMYTPGPPTHSIHSERMVIFGGPTCGFGLVAFGAIALPRNAFGLELVGTDVIAVTTLTGAILLGLLVVPLLYWVLVFIPIPDAFYPHWAREVREDRRRFPQTSPHQPPHPKDRPGTGPG
ncbi:hypothetical protein [Ruania zhangjianzhongii]|uniref:hypothetical protein n=1 Tax=Ruania zhangjianzhongii TaxID=2603206 RepID=UPI0011CAE4A3|nr:hypothetical protein [Ruania zhangjianzhongii]